DTNSAVAPAHRPCANCRYMLSSLTNRSPVLQLQITCNSIWWGATIDLGPPSADHLRRRRCAPRWGTGHGRIPREDRIPEVARVFAGGDHPGRQNRMARGSDRDA